MHCAHHRTKPFRGTCETLSFSSSFLLSLFSRLCCLLSAWLNTLLLESVDSMNSAYNILLDHVPNLFKDAHVQIYQVLSILLTFAWSEYGEPHNKTNLWRFCLSVIEKLFLWTVLLNCYDINLKKKKKNMSVCDNCCVISIWIYLPSPSLFPSLSISLSISPSLYVYRCFWNYNFKINTLRFFQRVTSLAALLDF